MNNRNNLLFSRDAIAITEYLVDIASPSHQETKLADILQSFFETFSFLKVKRLGNTVMAQTNLNKPNRIILAGHIDTVPVSSNLPAVYSDLDNKSILYGCGTADMKAGLACFLSIVAASSAYKYDITWICYDCEEVESKYNGLKRIQDLTPNWLQGDLAILGEPTNSILEAGCQGSLRVKLIIKGIRSHSARSWLGDNAIHKLGSIIQQIDSYVAKTFTISGCKYREGLSVVKISGGIAGNIIPDYAELEVNYRFAPNKSNADAIAEIYHFFDRYYGAIGLEFKVIDIAPAALPRLDEPMLIKLIEIVDQPVQAKLGWTDVARFSELNIPAINFGPGNPNLAHKPEEYVELEKINLVQRKLHNFLID